MRVNFLYAPDGMIGAGSSLERFDDGLVHNHHWAVTADEAYPLQDQGSGTDHERSAGSAASPSQNMVYAAYPHDHHDDGLVHNHHWAVSGQ